ncbi:MAG TPA: TIGR01906 family membrane protein [Anaerolineales bacterium]|nr:TIGR01906 family membrane protein [Anaerolineales bacterium]
MPGWLLKILRFLITVLVPVVLTLTAVRAMLSPWYLEFEYRTPMFPDDYYGFTMGERLAYGRVAVEYLVNDAGIEFLGDLRFPEGQETPAPSCANMVDCTYMYNDRELEHMLDVKNVVQGALRVWIAAFILLVTFGFWAWKEEWLPDYLQAVRRGGLLTIILIGVILLLVVAAFGFIFVNFHRIFFAEGTWTFLYSDTLIRLFPQRFWRDTFFMVGGLSAALGWLVWFVLGRIQRRNNG